MREDATGMDEPAPDARDIDMGMLRRPVLAVLAARIREHGALLRVARLQWTEGMEGGVYLGREEGRTFVGGAITIMAPVS